MRQNPNCSGSGAGRCSLDPETRRLPLPGGAGLFVCRNCYGRELQYRRDRNTKLPLSAQYDLPEWDALAPYDANTPLTAAPICPCCGRKVLPALPRIAAKMPDARWICIHEGATLNARGGLLGYTWLEAGTWKFYTTEQAQERWSTAP